MSEKFKAIVIDNQNNKFKREIKEIDQGDLKDGNDYFLHADSEEGTHKWRDKETFMPGGTFPLGWTRKYGNGKVFVTTLGHNGLSFKTPEYQKLVLNGINWVS